MHLIHEAPEPWAIGPARPGWPRDIAMIVSDLLPLLDLVVVLGVAWLGDVLTPLAWLAAALAPFVLYDKDFGTLAGRAEVARLAHAHAMRFALLSAMVLALGALVPQRQQLAPGVLLATFGAALALTMLTRAVLGRTVRRQHRRGLMREAIAVVGAGAVADRLVHSLRQERAQSIELLGIFDDASAPSGATAPSGTLAQLIELGQRRRIDWIVLTLAPTETAQLRSTVQRLRALSAPIGLCPQHVGLAHPYHATEVVGGRVPLCLLADRPIKRWDAVIKAIEDWLIGGMLTLLLLPLLAAVALAIRLSSPGPVIFRQRRHAENNREFDIYKFRTMRWSSDAPGQELQQTTRGDARVTRVGRFLRASSLDELPQLFNVLQGDMSLVGPRPHAVNMRTEDRLGHEITDQYAHRHRVKPGITGWSQVNGARGATDTAAQLQRRVTLDLHYIENWSLLLDLKILAMTAREVVKRTNAY